MRLANSLASFIIALTSLTLCIPATPEAKSAPVTKETVIEANAESDFLNLRNRSGLSSVTNGLGRTFTDTVDWSSYATLDCHLSNRNSSPVNLLVRLQSGTDTATFRGEVAPHTVTTWKIPIFHLRYATCPHWSSQQGVHPSFDGKKIDTTRISSVQFLRGDNTQSQIAIHGAFLSNPQKSTKWIDEFGQNSNVQYKARVLNMPDLASRDQIEAKALSNLEPKSAKQPELKGTGFFRLERYNDRWWLVDPAGHLFYSTAIDCAGCGAWTKLNPVSRNAYSWLPATDQQLFEEAMRKDSLSMYRANLIRKWGPSFETKCAQRAIDRMKHWGFNTLGNWTDPKLLAQNKMPYVSVGPKTWELKIPYLDGDIPDVYHPDFATEAERVAGSLSAGKTDQNLIGYFIDNELPWWNIPYDVFALEDDAPAKTTWMSRLGTRYSTINALNEAWGTKANDFKSLRWPGNEATPKALADMKELLGDFAQRFYATWYRAVKLADPNHLILGSRIPYSMDEVTEACAKNTDVLSINQYCIDPRKELERYYKMTGKPILIGEYAFDSLDAGLLTAWVPVQTQLDRAIGFSYYTETAAALPFVVGTHYFQYLDEPLTGRQDGETSFNGFVNVADIPYPHLVAAARKTNARVHAIHAGKLSPSRRLPR